MNAYEYLELMAERQVVEQLTRSVFSVYSANGNLLFFYTTADGNNWREGVDYFYLDCYNREKEDAAADAGFNLHTPEGVRFILEHLEEEFEIDKSLLGF